MLLISLFEAKKVIKTPEYHRRARISFSNFGGVYDTKYNVKALREKLLQSDVRVFENDAIVAAEVEDNIRHVESTWQNGDLAQFEWAYGVYDCCFHRIRHGDEIFQDPSRSIPLLRQSHSTNSERCCLPAMISFAVSAYFSP